MCVSSHLAIIHLNWWSVKYILKELEGQISPEQGRLFGLTVWIYIYIYIPVEPYMGMVVKSIGTWYSSFFLQKCKKHHLQLSRMLLGMKF